MARRKKSWDLPKLHEIMKKSFYDPEVEAAFLDERKRIEDKKTRISDFLSTLHVLSILEGRLGAATILDHQPNGWGRLRLSFLYKAWGARIYVGLQDKGKYGPIDVYELTLAFAHAIATREDSFSAWLGGRLIGSVNARDEKFDHWDIAPFHPFILRLYCLWKSIDCDMRHLKLCPLAVYQDILDAWENEKEMGKAIVAACDYHCLRSFDDPNGHPEFAWEPYNVFPAEILAIYRVRNDLGLATPRVSHPLLDSPLNQLPAGQPEIDDTVVKMVRERAVQDLPGISEPW